MEMEQSMEFPSKSLFSRIISMTLPAVLLSIAAAFWLNSDLEYWNQLACQTIPPPQFYHQHTVNGSTVFISIISVVAKQQLRNAIRQTWLNRMRELDSKLNYRFFIACSAGDQACFEQLADENNRQPQPDIVALTMTDSYKNVSLKTVASLIYPFQLQPSPPYYDYHMKIDEDVYVDADRLYNYYRQLEDGRTALVQLGRYRNNGMVIRDPYSKWYVPKQLWPSQYYDPYSVGPLHLTSRRLVEDIYRYLCCSANDSIPMEAIRSLQDSAPSLNNNKEGLGLAFTEVLYKVYRQRAYYYFEDVFLGYLVIQSQNGSLSAFRDETKVMYSLWPEEKCRPEVMALHGLNDVQMLALHECVMHGIYDHDKCKCLEKLT